MAHLSGVRAAGSLEGGNRGPRLLEGRVGRLAGTEAESVLIFSQ